MHHTQAPQQSRLSRPSCRGFGYGYIRLNQGHAELSYLAWISVCCFLLWLVWTRMEYPISEKTCLLEDIRIDLKRHDTFHTLRGNIRPVTANGTKSPVSVLVPGFFVVPESIVTASETPTALGFHATLPSKSSLGKREDGAAYHPRNNAVQTLTQRRDSHESIVHAAYPVRAGQCIDGEVRAKVKLELEDCARDLLRKLNGQSIETTPTFEVYLQNCKATMDSAIQRLYPILQWVSEDAKLDTHAPSTVVGAVSSNDPETVAPSLIRKNSGLNNSNYCVWHRPKSRWADRVCSKNFCRFTESCSGLDRCYGTNITGFDVLHCATERMEKLKDDFLPGAPLECNLCIPSPDCGGIDHHCQESEMKEDMLLKGALILIGSSLTASVLAIWGCGWYSKRKERKVLASLRQKGWLTEENQVIGTRTPVMPPAFRNAGVGRSGTRSRTG